MNTLREKRSTVSPGVQADFSDILKWHHKLAGLKLRKVNATTLGLINPYGRIVATFHANYLSPHPIWKAADREIARGYLWRNQPREAAWALS